MNKKGLIGKIVLLFFLVSNFNLNVFAAEDNNVSNNNEESNTTKAIEWLISKQNKDGSFGNSINKITTYEVLNVLSEDIKYKDSYSKGLSWARNIKEEKTIDYEARRLKVKDLSTDDEIKNLIEKENEDGGFGVAKNYGSDILDSDLVLDALIKQENKKNENINDIISYLLNRQNEDGSFSLNNNGEGNVEVTSQVVITLSNFYNEYKLNSPEIRNVIKKSVDFILSKQNEDKLFGSSLKDIRKSLLAFKALVAFQGISDMKDLDEISKIEETANKLQLENGSIKDDEYATALYIDLIKKISEYPKVELNSIKLYKKTNDEKVECDKFKPSDKMSIEVDGGYEEDKAEVNLFILDSNGGVVFQDNKFNSSWNVGEQDPGIYTVCVKIIDSKTKYSLAVISKNFTIEENYKINDLKTIIDCNSTLVNQATDINIKANFDYLANIDSNVLIKTEIKNNNKVVKEDVKEQQLKSSKENYDLSLLCFKPDVSEATTYNILIQIIKDNEVLCEDEKIFTVYEKQSDRGINVSQNKNKDILYPGKDGLNINFKLTGYEGNSNEDIANSFNVYRNNIATKNIMFANNSESQEQEYTFSNNSMSNKYIKYCLSNSIYSIGTIEGNPKYTSDNNQKLLYGYPGGGTSYATIKIDDNSYIYSYDSSVNYDTSEGSTITSQKIGNIKVQQKFSIVNNQNTGNNDMVEMKYIIKNEDTVNHEAGCRIMMDTMLSSNDSAPFRVPGIGSLSYEKEISGDDIPQYWQAFNTLSNPSVVSQGILYKDGITKPDLVQFMNWRKVYDNNWYTKATGGSTGDSAVTIFWNPNTLKPGEEREYVTYYGVGDLDIDITGSIAASVTGPTKLDATESGYSPNPFLVTSYVSNIGIKDLDNVQAKIVLPNGLKLADNETAIHDFGSLSVNNEKQTSWNIVAEDSLVEKTLTYAVVYSVGETEVKTVNRTINIPKCINNIAGRNVVLETTIPSSKLKVDENEISPKPSEIVNNNDGSQTIKWKFNKIYIDEVIDFEVKLSGDNLLSEDKYLITKDTTLSYINSDDIKEVRNLKNMNIEVDKYALDSDVKTDKDEYSSNEEVTINNITQNLHEYPVELNGKVNIYDSNMGLVKTINDNVVSRWNANEEKTDSYKFNTGSLISGIYTAKVDWLEGDKIIKTSYTTFMINNDGKLTNSVSTDKTQYNANEDINIEEKVKNTSTNTIEKSLKIKTYIIGPDNQEYMLDNKVLNDIMFNDYYSNNITWNTKSYAAGTYKIISQVYKDGEEEPISTYETSFEILESNKNYAQVNGNILIDDNNPHQFDILPIEVNLKNTGNVNIENIKTKVNIINIANGDIIKSFDDKVSVNIGESKALKYCLDTSNLDCGNYVIEGKIINNDVETVINKKSFSLEPLSDDFESNYDELNNEYKIRGANMWQCMGNAYRSENGYLVLTENKPWQAGAVWLKKNINGPFTARFKYKAGEGTSGDGFTFMFYKNPEIGGNGREIGFKQGNGYGLEFDSFYDQFYGENTGINGQNVAYGKNHIALSKDNISTGNCGEVIDSLAVNANEEFTNKINDNHWHNVEIRVRKNEVNVYVDGEKAISYVSDKELDKTYSGIGFSAATGQSYENHFIDDVEIYKYDNVDFNDDYITDINSPQIIGSKINLTNSTYGGVSSSQYKFTVYNENGTVDFTRDYSPKNTAQWIPSKTGKYKIEFSSKDKDNNVITETKDFEIKEKLEITKLSVDNDENIFIGDTLIIKADTAGGVGNTQCNYQILQNNKIISESGYTENNTFNIVADKSGYYTLRCEVKDEAGNIAEKDMNLKVNTKDTILLNEISTDIESPQVVGKTIKLTTNALSGDNLKYRFTVLKDGKSVYTRGYNNRNTATWIPSKAGDYVIHFKVKNEDGVEKEKTINYSIFDKGDIIIKNCNIDKASPQKIGTILNLATDAASNEKLKYRFTVLKDGSSVYTRGYNSKNTATWTPSEVGEYTIVFKVKNTSGKEVSKSITYEIEE